MNPFQVSDEDALKAYSISLQRRYGKQTKEAHAKAAARENQKCLCEVCNNPNS